MASRFRWLAATTIAAAVAAAAAGLTAAVTGPAQAVSAPASGWRITAVYPEDSGVGPIAAASASNAWAAENCTKPCHTGSGGLTLRHWNGRQWRTVKDPAVLSHTSGGSPMLAMAPGATSTLWAIYPYAPDASHRQAVAVHWTGKSWAAPTWFQKNSSISAVVAPGSSAVWAFGRILPAGQPYVLRYNGRSWRDAPSPGIIVVSASAASPADIWVTGIRLGAAKGAWPMVVSHWNGAKWTTAALPRVPVPAQSSAQPLSIVAGGPRDAWALGYKTGPGGSVVPNDGTILYHWNGAKWSPVTIPYAQSQEYSISSDGHGGIWSWAEVDPGHHDYLIHDRNGLWSEVTALRPAIAFSVALSVTAIAGSSSLWASGAASVPIPIGGNPGGTEGLILKYGA